MAVSQPGDAAERAADAIAERALAAPRAAPDPSAGPARAAAPPAAAAPFALGAGAPLGEAERADFEPRFGADLSAVRVHTGRNAAETAAGFNARAFAWGPHLVFGPGEFRPDTDAGRRLLAHELAHAIGAPPGVVHRTAYSDCTEEQRPSLEAAVSAGLAALGAALGRLRERPLGQHASDALWLMFRDRSERMAGYAAAVLAEMSAGLPGATIECEQPEDFLYGWMCGEGIGGYVRIGSVITGIGHVHLCMGEWEGMSDTVRMHAVLHEAAHLHSRTQDFGYFNAEDCSETDATASAAATTPVGITPVSRTDNADCYACLARMLGAWSAQQVADRVAMYQGDTLRLRQNPPGEIDLSASEGSTVFSMGIPSVDDPGRTDVPGTFQFRWVLWDGERNEYELQGLFGGRVREFGRSQSQVIIPAATRALLRARGVTRGTLYCRYMMVGMGERLYWLPLRFGRSGP